MQHGFDRSTFTEEAWHRMAAGPRFDPALDLVAWDPDGIPVAGATAWSAGPGAAASSNRSRPTASTVAAGHGRRVVQAAFDALLRSARQGWPS